MTSTFHSFRAVSRFSKQLRPDTSTRVFIRKKKVFIAQIELTWDPENQEPERQTISTRERQTRVNKKRRNCLHSKQFAQDVIKARFIIVFHVRIFEQVVFVLFVVQLVEQERQQQQQQRKRKRRERRQRQDVERPDWENGQAGHRDRLSEKVNKQNNYKQKNTTDSASLPSFLPLITPPTKTACQQHENDIIDGKLIYRF